MAQITAPLDRWPLPRPRPVLRTVVLVVLWVMVLWAALRHASFQCDERYGILEGSWQAVVNTQIRSSSSVVQPAGNDSEMCESRKMRYSSQEPPCNLL